MDIVFDRGTEKGELVSLKSVLVAYFGKQDKNFQIKLDFNRKIISIPDYDKLTEDDISNIFRIIEKKNLNFSVKEKVGV
jgi:hypothetical protein